MDMTADDLEFWHDTIVAASKRAEHTRKTRSRS